MTKAVFYSGTKNASSWAMRAWLALRAAGFDYLVPAAPISLAAAPRLPVACNA